MTVHRQRTLYLDTLPKWTMSIGSPLLDLSVQPDVDIMLMRAHLMVMHSCVNHLLVFCQFLAKGYWILFGYFKLADYSQSSSDTGV